MKIIFYCGEKILDVIENVATIDEASEDMISYGGNEIKNIACDYVVVDDHVDSSAITPELLALDRKNEFKSIKETIQFLIDEIGKLKNRMTALETKAQ